VGDNWLEKLRDGKPQHEPEVAASGQLEQDAQTERDASGYRPFYRPHVPSVRLRFVLRGGESWTLPYSQILLVRFLPPDVLAVHSGTHLYMIEGRELDQLDAMLADEDCAVIVEHDEAAHGPAPEAGPLIESITVQGPEAANVDDVGEA
jgi:hypothetical protein